MSVRRLVTVSVTLVFLGGCSVLLDTTSKLADSGPDIASDAPIDSQSDQAVQDNGGVDVPDHGSDQSSDGGDGLADTESDGGDGADAEGDGSSVDAGADQAFDGLGDDSIADADSDGGDDADMAL